MYTSGFADWIRDAVPEARPASRARHLRQVRTGPRAQFPVRLVVGGRRDEDQGPAVDADIGHAVDAVEYLAPGGRIVAAVQHVNELPDFGGRFSSTAPAEVATTAGGCGVTAMGSAFPHDAQDVTSRTKARSNQSKWRARVMGVQRDAISAGVSGSDSSRRLRLRARQVDPGPPARPRRGNRRLPQWRSRRDAQIVMTFERLESRRDAADTSQHRDGGSRRTALCDFRICLNKDQSGCSCACLQALLSSSRRRSEARQVPSRNSRPL